MKYVNEDMFVPEAGDREFAPNFVLIITDGRSQDEVNDSAEALRNRGVMVRAQLHIDTRGPLHLST